MLTSKLKGRRLNAILGIKKVRQLKNISRFKQIFTITSREFLFNSGTNSYNHPVEKAITIIVYVASILGMLVMVIDATLEYKSSPTVTTAETSSYPVQKIDYPAIAICSMNRISRKAVISLAQELMEFETTTYNVNLTVTELANLLELLGNLYNFETNGDLEKMKLLHTILERGYNGYDVGRIMKRLTPKCRSMIRKCFWEGKDQVCDDIFFLRKTENGYCCTFNYARRNDGFGSGQNGVFIAQETERSTNIGSEYGLSVLLHPQSDDNSYKLLPSQGFKVFVYSSLDYPDVLSGGLQEVLISPKTENYIDLDAITFYSVPGVKKYDIYKRDCLFSDEQSKIFHGHYSFGDCIIHCRTKDILELCKCISFFHPVADDTGSARICNLKDLPCLESYKDRWQRVKPRYENNMKPFDEKILDATSGYLDCDCLPSCEDVTYTASRSTIPLTVPELFWGRTKLSIRNHSIVHIYFGKSGTMRLRQDVLFYWYELMSNYGGICSFFLGVSIINFVEIVYNTISILCKSQESLAESEKPMQNTIEIHEAITDIEITTSTEMKNIPETSVLYWNEISRSVKEKDVHLPDLFLKYNL